MDDELTEEFKGQKQAVEHRLMRAALDYFEFSRAAGFRMEIPDTDPPVYIVLGERELAMQLLSDPGLP